MLVTSRLRLNRGRRLRLRPVRRFGRSSGRPGSPEFSRSNRAKRSRPNRYRDRTRPHSAWLPRFKPVNQSTLPVTARFDSWLTKIKTGSKFRASPLPKLNSRSQPIRRVRRPYRGTTRPRGKFAKSRISPVQDLSPLLHQDQMLSLPPESQANVRKNIFFSLKKILLGKY